jgi:hypothetical protein
LKNGKLQNSRREKLSPEEAEVEYARSGKRDCVFN